jgi:hypothetical protein
MHVMVRSHPISCVVEPVACSCDDISYIVEPVVLLQRICT